MWHLQCSFTAGQARLLALRDKDLQANPCKAVVAFYALTALDLFCGLDQVGTLKLLTTASGQVVKLIERNSFGERPV